MKLLDRAVSVIPPHLHERVVVYGSAPIVFAGLKPEVAFDLDVFVDDVPATSGRGVRRERR